MNVYFLLDRSGSMAAIWEEALGGINGYIQKLTPDTNVFLAAFDSVSFDVLRRTTVAGFKPINGEEVFPRGTTPLFDSAARVMHRMLYDNPERAVFVVMTDGEENQSKNTTQADVLALNRVLDARKYETFFLGANFEKVGDVAQKFGRQQHQSVSVGINNMRSYMAGDLAAQTVAYAATGAAMSVDEATKKRVKT